MRIRHRSTTLALLLLLGAAGSMAAAPKPPRYHRVTTVHLGGEGRWDYVAFDTVGRRVFVAHGSQVDVIDADAGKVIGAVPGTAGAHGIAFAHDLGRGFITNGADSSVTVFDLKTLAPLARVPTGGANPDAILYDPATHRIFAFNADAGTATAIDARTDSVLGRVELGGAPEFAVADGRGTVFVNLEDSSRVVAFDSRQLAVRHAWPLAPCEEPTGMAMDRAQRRLFIGCHNKLMAVMNGETGRVIATLPIGARVDANAFDAGTGLAFSSNGDGTLTVVQRDGADRFHVVSQVKTERGARTMALDPRTHRVFLVTADYEPDPPAAADGTRPRPKTVPDTFRLLVYAP